MSVSLCSPTTSPSCAYTLLQLSYSTLPLPFGPCPNHLLSITYKSDMSCTQIPGGIPSLGIKHIDLPSKTRGPDICQFSLLLGPSVVLSFSVSVASYIPLSYELTFFLILAFMHAVPFSSFLRSCNVQILLILLLKSKNHSLIFGDFLSIIYLLCYYLLLFTCFLIFGLSFQLDYRHLQAGNYACPFHSALWIPRTSCFINNKFLVNILGTNSYTSFILCYIFLISIFSYCHFFPHPLCSSFLPPPFQHY